MADTIKKRLLKAIEKYKQTGKLPKEWDTVDKERSRPMECKDAIDRAVFVEPFESEDAWLFAEGVEEFLAGLSEHERFVYDVVLVGGMKQIEAGAILGVSGQRIGQLVTNVRSKAKKAINTQKLRMKRAEAFFNL